MNYLALLIGSCCFLVLTDARAEFQVQEGNPKITAAGDPLPGLTSDELAFFNEGRGRFLQVDSVKGTEPGTIGNGLGPRFNLNSCVGCHAQPAPGGTSPAINPQIAVATEYGAHNTIPYFISLFGPVREARFIFNPDGSRDGGVHNDFVISGRQDAASCNILQPDFAAENLKHNVSLRIPTPLFGMGLIEEIEDSTLIANKNTDLKIKHALRIYGHENRSGNDGTITRFGWKAQNKSAELFAGEAYNVEQGVTNELFQTERDETPGCVLNGTPEDHTNFGDPNPVTVMSDVVGFRQFMVFLAPLQPQPPTPASQHGRALFSTIGCVQCHTPQLTTGPASSLALSNQPVHLFSDLLVHHMGSGLADNIVQGLAGPDEFRTAPLWGVGKRLFFLHDGRTSDLTTAILEHRSRGLPCEGGGYYPLTFACESEANEVIENFQRLCSKDKADLVSFLQTL